MAPHRSHNTMRPALHPGREEGQRSDAGLLKTTCLLFSTLLHDLLHPLLPFFLHAPRGAWQKSHQPQVGLNLVNLTPHPYLFWVKGCISEPKPMLFWDAEDPKPPVLLLESEELGPCVFLLVIQPCYWQEIYRENN